VLYSYLENDSSNEHLWNQFGLTLIHKAEEDANLAEANKREELLRGISAFSNALRLNPFMPSALVNLGQALLELGELLTTSAATVDSSSPAPDATNHNFFEKDHIVLCGRVVLLWCLCVHQVSPQDKASATKAARLLLSSIQEQSPSSSSSTSSSSSSATSPSPSSRAGGVGGVIAARRVLQQYYGVDKENISTFSARLLSSVEKDPLRIALLMACLYLALDEESPKSECLPELVQSLLRLLETMVVINTSTLAAPMATAATTSPRVTPTSFSSCALFDYLPPTCVVSIIEVQLLVILITLEHLLRSPFTQAMTKKSHNGKTGVAIASELAATLLSSSCLSSSSSPLPLLHRQRHHHRFVLQFALTLLTVLPSSSSGSTSSSISNSLSLLSLSSHHDESGNNSNNSSDDQEATLQLWRRATRLLEHSYLGVSSAAVDFLQSRLENSGSGGSNKKRQLQQQQQLLEVLVQEKGFAGLERALRSSQNTMERITKVVRLLDTLTSGDLFKEKGDYHSLLISNVTTETNLVKALQLLLEAVGNVSDLTDKMRRVLKNLGVSVDNKSKKR